MNKPRSMPTSREAVISDMFAVMWSILLKVASNHVKMVRRFQSSHSMIFRGLLFFTPARTVLEVVRKVLQPSY